MESSALTGQALFARGSEPAGSSSAIPSAFFAPCEGVRRRVILPGVRDRRDTGRIEAFSDGVFSIAATLLVLEIAVPEADFTSLEGDRRPVARLPGLRDQLSHHRLHLARAPRHLPAPAFR